MPRTARIMSKSNIYHVMLRGINRQIIFEDDGDKHYFLTVLKCCKEISGFRLHAFCLMSNHVHLLIEPAGEPLDIIFKRIGARYVLWYNRKYNRTGHLFQDRFRSENVENHQYYMTVLRYILQNPMKSGLESHPGTYRWSSYLAYEKGAGAVTDTQYTINLFGCHKTLIDYLQQNNEDHVMDEENCDWRLKDDLAQRIMRRITNCISVSEFQQLERPIQKEYIQEMHLENMTSRQISRLTGLSKTTILRIIKEFNNFPDNQNESLALHESSEFNFIINPEEIW